MCYNKKQISYRSLHLFKDGVIRPISNSIVVPCNKCLECLKTRRNQWFLRAWQQFENSDSAIFITLTYNNDNLPFAGVSVRDIQLFIKRVREENRKYTDKKLSYYFVSEYGNKHKRPHYHGIIYNCELDIDVIEEKWNKGFIYVGEVNSKSINYVSKYIGKIKFVPRGQRKNFILFSKSLGMDFIKNHPLYSKKYFRVYTDKSSYIIPLPRSWRQRYNSLDEDAGRDPRFPLYDEQTKLSDFYSTKFLKAYDLTESRLNKMTNEELDKVDRNYIMWKNLQEHKLKELTNSEQKDNQ